jgi:hypothetical protein
MPSMTQEKPKQMKIKQETGAHKSENRAENKGDKKFSQAGSATERGRGSPGKDTYLTLGATSGMHGKARGGHPTKRAEEMKGY